VTEGQTFAKKVNEQIFPSFLTVVDDATQKRLGQDDLLGYYQFDDEGVAGQRVVLVDHGVLKNFEMSRSPLKDFARSNGHVAAARLAPHPFPARAICWWKATKWSPMPSSRQTDRARHAARQALRPVIDDIAGGLPFTGRGQPQAFQVEPLVVYKVFADGRPDQLVRGVDIVGTPLAALTKIVATGDTVEVFNGYCGAESGYVPVSPLPLPFSPPNWKCRRNNRPRIGRPFCRPRRTTFRNRRPFSNAR